MKLSEQIRRDRERYSQLTTTSSKLAFLWDYYKYPIIAAVSVIAIRLISIFSNLGKANVNLYVVLLNNDSSVIQCDESVFRQLMSNAGYDMDKHTVDVNTDLSLGRDNSETADMETMQVLTALFSISDLDVYAADKEYFDYFAENDGYADLSLLIDKDILNKHEADLYTYTNSKGQQVTGGIILHSGSPLHKAGYYHNDVIIGVVGNAVHFEEAVAFIKQLLLNIK